MAAQLWHEEVLLEQADAGEVTVRTSGATKMNKQKERIWYSIIDNVYTHVWLK